MRQAITSKVSFPSLSVTRHVSLFQEYFHSNVKIDLEIFRFIRMKCISSYCKRNNSMIYRHGMCFYSMSSAWKVQIIHILHHVKVSQAYVSICSPWRPGMGPFPAILQVMWHLDPLWLGPIGPASEVGGHLQNCSRNWGEAQIEVNFVIFVGLTSCFFGLIMFWNSW